MWMTQRRPGLTGGAALIASCTDLNWPVPSAATVVSAADAATAPAVTVKRNTNTSLAACSSNDVRFIDRLSAVLRMRAS